MAKADQGWIRVSWVSRAAPPLARGGCVLGVLGIPPGCEGFWGACESELARRGVALCAIAEHLHGPASPLPGLEGSFATLSLLGRCAPLGAPLGPEPDAGVLERCLAYDRVYWSTHPGFERLAVRGARIGVRLIEDAVETLRPRLAVIWNGSSSFARLCDHELRRRGVPILYAERGPFSPCVVVDPIGVVGRSGLVSQAGGVAARPPTPGEIEAGRAIAERLGAHRVENWPRAGASAEAGDMARGDVAFFASSEAGFAGLSREDLRSHGMPLGVSYTACEALLRAARSARARPRVFVKAHPHEPHPGRYERLASEHGATWAPWLGVYDAIAVGCVIATTSESVAWIALAAGARVLALTRRPYGPAGAVYEADGESTLPEALGGALEGRGHEAMRARGQVAVARYARECCFSHAGEWTALGVSGAGAFVERLLRDARPAGPSEPARWLERLADAGFESRTSAEAA